MQKLNDHYRENAVQIQIIDVIRSMPFDLGNVFKYMTRLNSKGQRQDDLAKIYYYSTCALSSMQDMDLYELYNRSYIRSRMLLLKFRDIFKNNGFEVNFPPQEWALKSKLEYIRERSKQLILN